MSGLRRTPLHDAHVRLGARLVPFAGWALPVQYTSILAEHRAVRERVGLFDVSHMGQLHLSGPGAEGALERLLSCPVASLAPGRVRYGLLCNEAGGVVDDVTLYRTDASSFFLCVNAANREKDREWVERHLGAGTALSDRSDATAMLALQGPESAAVLRGLCDADVDALRRFRFLEGKVAGAAALVSRTGYTGSDGFELYLAAGDAEAVFEALCDSGRPHGLAPAGLGARDTLRIEAALPLYGHELDDETTPLEAGLGRFVKLDAGGFVGAEAIGRREAGGRRRQLVGLELEGRGVAREGHGLWQGGAEVGRVTSGAPSPTLGRSIALGYVSPSLAAVGTPLEVAIRGRRVPARVVETPFVRPRRTRAAR